MSAAPKVKLEERVAARLRVPDLPAKPTAAPVQGGHE